MKIKKLIFLIILMISIILIFPKEVLADQELNELDFEAQINEDGSMDVTETWNIYISETNTLFKTFEKDKSKYSGITNVMVKEITSGQQKEFSQIDEEMYHVTKDCFYALDNSKGNFEIAWGVGLDDDSATKVYQISYTVEDAIAKYNDYAELYWKFIGDDFEIDADNIKGTILLPSNANSKDEIRVWGHTEGLNGEIYATAPNKIEFSINKYSVGNFVEVRSLFPNSMITSTNRTYNYDILDKVIEEETVWANEANERRESRERIGLIITIILSVIAVFLIINVIKNILKLLKMEKKIKPSTKLDYFRELPYEDATPGEALFVLTTGANKNFSSSFSANILDLCLKKYLTLEAIKEGKIAKSDVIKIQLLDKNENELKEDQKITLDLLKKVAGEKKELTTKDITKYLQKHQSELILINKNFSDIIEKQEIQNENYIKDNYKKMTQYGGFATLYIGIVFFSIPFGALFVEEMGVSIYSILGIAIPAVINMLILAIMSFKINVFTQKGIDEREKWKAFKKYMEDFSLLKDKEVPALALWEKYLVFATAFGISDKVLKQLKVIYPEINDMNSAMYTYSYIHIMNSVNIGNCINSSVYSATGSSGTGAGGGFSGGGGGGRWPEAAVADAKI